MQVWMQMWCGLGALLTVSIILTWCCYFVTCQVFCCRLTCRQCLHWVLCAAAVELSLSVCNIAGHDCSIRLWNLESKTCVQEITSHRKKFDESIHDVAFHPSKPFIASAGADALAKVFAWCSSSSVTQHDSWCVNECLWSTVYFTQSRHSWGTHTHELRCGWCTGVGAQQQTLCSGDNTTCRALVISLVLVIVIMHMLLFSAMATT